MGGLLLRWAGLGARKHCKDALTARTPRSNGEIITAGRLHLRQHQVKAGGGFGPRTHGGAETIPPRDGAVDGDKKSAFSGFPVRGIHVFAGGEHAVLNIDGGELAGPDTEESEFAGGRLGAGRRDGKPFARLRRGEERQPGRKEIFLPRLRTHDKPKIEIVVAASQAVPCRRLFVAVAARQILDGGYLVIDDRFAADGRTDEGVTTGEKSFEQNVKVG